MSDDADIALIVSSPDSDGVHHDGEIDTVVHALEGQGLKAVAVPWTDRVDWGGFRAAVLKSPWDYSMRSEEFSRWLSQVESRIVVLNHPEIVRWNFDKRYLGELREAGLNVTQFACADSTDQARDFLATLKGSRAVVKPTVSAGSRNTGLFDSHDPRALDLVASILRLDKVPMIMPALDAVERHGERGLLFFGGEFSHCGRKAPILAPGGGYLGGTYTEVITPDDPPPDEIELGEQCLKVVAKVAAGRGVPARYATPLYARIDIARDRDGRPCILEAELFEPSYFTHLDEASADRFATALRTYVL